MKQSTSKNTWLTDSLWLTIGIGFFYFLFLGSRALNVPDEARYSEIPREMVATGHYLVPHLDYIIYFEKPDLFYWLQSLSIKLFGLSEWSMRFWVCTLGVLTCLAAYLAGRKLFDRATGLYSALILASSLLFYLMSHYITLDMPISFFLTISLLTFIIGANESHKQKRRLYIYTAAAIAALAVLTKGLIGIAFPCMIIGLWVLLLNQWKLLTKLYIPSALLVFALVAVPWHLLMAKAQPGWAYFYFITQQFTRYATENAGRYQPIWFFIPFIIVGLFPWIIFLPQAIKDIWPRWQQRKKFSNELFLLIWGVAIFIFFSLSDSKLIPYIVPVFPPLAILLGRYLARVDQGKIKAQFNRHFWILIFIGMIVALGFFIVPLTTVLPNPYIAYLHVTMVNIVLIVMVFFANKCYRQFGLRKACIALLTGMAILLPMVNLSIAHIDDRSIKPLALKIRPILKPSDVILDYHHYFQDLPFYLRRRVVIIDWRNELTFGMHHQDVSAWVWTLPQFLERWSTPSTLFGLCNDTSSLPCRENRHRMFAFMDLDTYHAFQKSHPGLKMYVIAHTNRNVVLSNEKVNL